MSGLLYLAVGLLLGFGATWLYFRGRAASSETLIGELRARLSGEEAEVKALRAELDGERQSRTASETRYEEASRNLREQKELLDKAKEEMSDRFRSLSMEALTKSSNEFLKLAEEVLKAQTAAGRKELEGKKELINQSIETVEKSISEIRKKLEDVGKGNAELSAVVKSHADIASKLNDTASHLKQALASSKKRGEWGERMAEDVIRLAGMAEGINYIKQKTIEGSSGRPDYTFLLPNGMKIHMDVKFPMENYQHYLDSETEHDRKRFREELLRGARSMIRDLTKNREYINPSDNTVDYVIIFVPNEQVYGFINESDTALMDDALKQKVVLCSPFTLYAVLAVIRQAVENFNLERTASEILILLGEFSKQWNAYKEKFRLMGERLDAARKEYDSLVTTRSNMLERPLRKIDELSRQRAITTDETLEIDG